MEELVTVKLIDVLNAPYCNSWSHFCDKYGINEWCINEGLADETIKISKQGAKFYGLLNNIQ